MGLFHKQEDDIHKTGNTVPESGLNGKIIGINGEKNMRHVKLDDYNEANPLITWRESQNDVRFSSYAELSHFCFSISKSQKLRCVKYENGGCLHNGWEPRNFICKVDYKIKIINKLEFIRNMVKDVLYYYFLHLNSDLIILDEITKSVFLKVFESFEVSFRNFKKNLKMQNFICDYIILLTEKELKEKGLKLVQMNIRDLSLLVKGYTNLGISADYGVYSSYSGALYSNIPDIDTGETEMDSLRKDLNSGLITQRMFDLLASEL